MRRRHNFTLIKRLILFQICNAMQYKFITCLFILIAVYTQAQHPRNSFVFNAVTGYERQNLTWSIAGNANGSSPNIYSELKWKSVSGICAEIDVKWNCWKKFILIGAYSRLIVTKGIVTDHDYNGDNRTNEIYGATYAADRGLSAKWRAGIGYRLVDHERFVLTANSGYISILQVLSLRDDTGNSGLNSNYKPHWNGAFVQTQMALDLGNRWRLAGDISYSQLKYKATADWNLIQSFEHPVSFRHYADGCRADGSVSIAMNITRHLSAHICAAAFFMQTGNGIDELYLTDGTISKTRLNGLTCKGTQLLFGFTFTY